MYSIQNRINSSWQTEYCSYLHSAFIRCCLAECYAVAIYAEAIYAEAIYTRAIYALAIYAEAIYAEAIYAEFQLCWLSFMLSVADSPFMLNVVMLIVLVP